jgi:hypothetical protein
VRVDVCWTDGGFPSRKWWNEVLKFCMEQGGDWSLSEARGDLLLLWPRRFLAWCHVSLHSVFRLPIRAGPFFVLRKGSGNLTQNVCTLVHWVWSFPWYCRYFPWWMMASEWGNDILWRWACTACTRLRSRDHNRQKNLHRDAWNLPK